VRVAGQAAGHMFVSCVAVMISHGNPPLASLSLEQNPHYAFLRGPPAAPGAAAGLIVAGPKRTEAGPKRTEAGRSGALDRSWLLLWLQRRIVTPGIVAVMDAVIGWGKCRRPVHGCEK